MKIPKPFYRKARQCWYVQLDGKQIRLSKDKKEAWNEYHRLMLSRGPDDEDLSDPRATVMGLCQRFLFWQKTHGKESTYWFYALPLDSFTQFIGGQKQVRDLRTYHVEEWLDAKYPTAGQSYRHNLIRVVKRPFTWAVRMGYIAKNPLLTLKRCGQKSRDCYITPAQWGTFLDLLPPGPFRDIVIVLRATGARPQEIRAVEKRHFDAENRCLRIPASEGKGGIERTIHLDDAQRVAFQIVERLAKRYPEGPLFRNTKGQPWTGHGLGARFAYLKDKLDFPITAYALRHTYATDALTNGVDCQTVASQLGHTNLLMLSKVYQHLNKNPSFLKQEQARATAGVRLSIGP
jgi:integrase